MLPVGPCVRFPASSCAYAYACVRPAGIAGFVVFRYQGGELTSATVFTVYTGDSGAGVGGHLNSGYMCC